MVGESRNAADNGIIASRQSFDITFDLLSNRRRRCTLVCLLEQQETIPLADLAEAVAIREQGTPITEFSAEEIQEVETSLYHWHIPKLADAGVVEYEPERTLVKLTEIPDQIERFIALAPDGG